MACEPSSSSGKRKSGQYELRYSFEPLNLVVSKPVILAFVARQAAVKVKRHKDSSESDSELNSDDSDFKVSNSESASEEQSEATEAESSDFSDTDSDGKDFSSTFVEI